jgi:hypothetical protein
MARKSTKIAENTAQTIADALDTPLNLDWDVTAETLNVTIPELQERMASKLDDTVFTWANIPVEHQSVVDAVTRDLDAERSIRSFGEEREPVAKLPPVVEEELPIILDEAPKPKRGKGGKLTQKKTEAISKGREASSKTQKGVSDALTILQAQQGIQDAAQAGSTYLHAFTATLGKVKGQGLTTIAAQMLQELNDKSGFTPDEILQDLGIELSADIQNELMEVLNPALGKYQQATEEILETSWGNGFNLQEELENLTGLLNSSN